MVAIASFLSTCINDFSSDSLIPFIQNCVQDHKVCLFLFPFATSRLVGSFTFTD
jgi:hypothetical protein